MKVTEDEFHRFWESILPEQRYADDELSKLGYCNLLMNSVPITTDEVPSYKEVSNDRRLGRQRTNRELFEIYLEDTEKNGKSLIIKGLELLRKGLRKQGVV